MSLASRLVLLGRRNAFAVVLAGLALALISGFVAWERLSFSGDADRMFGESLPWRQSQIAFDRAFPQFRDTLVAVVDGETPEIADATAEGLATALTADPAHFTAVRRPDASPWLAREGFLLLDKSALEAAMARAIDAQPFLGQLAADPSARGLFGALALLGVGVSRQGLSNPGAGLAPYEPAFATVHAAIDGALEGKPTPLSWTRLLSGTDDGWGGGTHRIVLVSLVGGTSQADDALHAAGEALEFVKSGAAHVRVDGPSTHPGAAAAPRMGSTVAIGLALIVLWLFFALRSWRLVLPVLATIGVGLLTSLLFAALTVRTLTPVSGGFALLFIGIAAGLAIQLCVRLRRTLKEAPDLASALDATAVRAGGPILLAAGAAGAGFVAFVPGAFAGAAELGLIGAAGMIIAALCTLIFLPAAIALSGPMPDRGDAGLVWALPLDRLARRWRGAILGGFAAVLLLSLAALPRLAFDAGASIAAVPTLDGRAGSPLPTADSAEIIAADADAADTLARQLRQQAPGSTVRTLDSFVPADQGEKIPLIADAASILSPSLAPRPAAAAPVTAEQIRLGAKTALAQIEPAVAGMPADHGLGAIAGDLRKLIAAPDAVLLSCEQVLIRFLPTAIDRLRVGLTAAPVTRADIPPEIARDWLLADGRARVQVVANDGAGLADFVGTVRAVAPDAAGPAVRDVEAAQTVGSSFRTAVILALVLIVGLLFAVLRRPRDVILALLPLLPAGALTVLACVLTQQALTAETIVALPLLLGIGVAFNACLIMRWRARPADGVPLLGSASARAVLFSALVAATAFATLAFGGSAGLGGLLLTGLGAALISSLVFLPALLTGIGPRTEPSGTEY